MPPGLFHEAITENAICKVNKFPIRDYHQTLENLKKLEHIASSTEITSISC